MKKNALNRKNAIAFALFHVGAVTAMFYFSWGHVILAFAMMFIAGALGVGVCYHRLLTHRGFILPKWLEYAFTTCACLSLQGGALRWVCWHRIHHAHTEEPGVDPHTPLDGVFWSHMGWLIYLNQQMRDPKLVKKWARDLFENPVHCWLSQYHWLPITVIGVMLLIFGGIPITLWGVFVPVVVGWHMTWLVNSATHMWGYRRFPTKDNSRNNWPIALVTWGEGNHNNHHHNPKAARHAVAWWEPDLNWYVIWALRRVGLAKKVLT